MKNGKLIELGKIELRLLDSVNEVLKKEFEELEFSSNISIAVFQKFIEIISKKIYRILEYQEGL